MCGIVVVCVCCVVVGDRLGGDRVLRVWRGHGCVTVLVCVTVETVTTEHFV